MKGLIAAHSGMRYIILLLLVIAIINAIANLKSDKYGKKDKLLNLFAMVFLHIQLLVGLILYFIDLTKNTKVRFGEGMMSDPIARFFTMEHLLMMIVAIALVTIGYMKSKKAEPKKKHRLVLRYYGLGLIVIFVAIPWPFIYEFAANIGIGYF